MRLLALIAAILVFPVVAFAQPIGHWQQDDMGMGAAVTYDIAPDGEYVKTFWKILPGRREPVQAERGAWAVAGNQIQFRSSGGRVENYPWGVMAQSGGRSSILTLGGQQFFSVGPAPAANGNRSGARDCDAAFLSCSTGNTPYQVCSRNFEMCKAR